MLISMSSIVTIENKIDADEGLEQREEFYENVKRDIGLALKVHAF